MSEGEPAGGLPAEAFAEVLTAARAGAGWAFERLFDELSPAVAGYLRLRGATDPEGLTNEVFLGVFRGIGRFTGDAEGFRRWVFTIAHRRVVDERRRAAARPRQVAFDPATHDRGGGDVEAEALAAVGEGWVQEALGRLTPAQRDVLALRILGDLTVEQVAEVVGKRPGAVKQLQRRGLERLRREADERAVTLRGRPAITETT